MKINLNPDLKSEHFVVMGTVFFAVVIVLILSISLYREYKNPKPKQRSSINRGSLVQEQKDSFKSERQRLLELERKRAADARSAASKKAQEDKNKLIQKNEIAIQEEEPVTITDVDWEKDLKEILAEEDITFQLPNTKNQRGGTKTIKAGKKYYSVGEVRDGIYKNKDLFMFLDPPMGGEGFAFFVFEEDGKGVLLSSRNIEVREIDDLPSSIIAPNSHVVLQRGWNRTRLFKDLDIDKKLFTDSSGRSYYQTKGNCVVVKLPDHTALAYNAQVPFVDKGNGKNSMNVYFDEFKNSESYSYNKISGCGALCSPLNAVELKRDELIYTGRTNSGDKVYELKDKEHEYLKDLYNDKNTLPYVDANREKEGGSKYTYEEFLSLRPLFFWNDPFGNWIRFMNNKFASAAEMCKPVIYLYPESKSDISVRVYPNGGFTYTEPEYEDEWLVSANPNGEIVDLRTGKKHEYLFWEGIGLGIEKITKGWVVKSSEMEPFLEEKLIKLGLNAKERGDFKEYWVDKLSEEGSYKISFLEKDTFDEIAPLEVAPIVPDNTIRVFMLARKAEDGEELDKQNLPEEVKRDGFTLVEWGGALLK